MSASDIRVWTAPHIATLMRATCRSRRRGRNVRNAAYDREQQYRVAQHAAPMQPPQPAHRRGIAGIPGVELDIPLPQKPAARPDRESRDQGNANRENRPTRQFLRQKTGSAGSSCGRNRTDPSLPAPYEQPEVTGRWVLGSRK